MLALTHTMKGSETRIRDKAIIKSNGLCAYMDTLKF